MKQKFYSQSFSVALYKQEQSVYIFTKASSTLDCNTIHNTILESLQDNATYKDISLQDLYSYEIYVFLDSILLNGAKEIETNPLYFGETDSKGEFIESSPIYYLETDSDEFDTESNSTNSSRTNTNRVGTSTLQVFLNDSTLTLLNYSLLDSSLNIKLECKSKESKAIQEREKAQREQKEQDCQSQDSLSTAMLHPVLEDNEIKCPHGGVVKLKSNKGKPFKSKDVPMILESDLLNSQIIGCTNNILGVPTPCTQVSVILPTARALKKYNDDYPIMQNLVSGNIFTDKGFPLIATPKPNTFKINSPKPTQANTQSEESLLSEMQFTKPKPSLYYNYKEHGWQRGIYNDI